LIVKEVARHRVACLFVGYDADKERQLAVGHDVLFGELVTDMLGPVPRVVGQRLPDFFLPLARLNLPVSTFEFANSIRPFSSTRPATWLQCNVERT
jgi:hypothetical protein